MSRIKIYRKLPSIKYSSSCIQQNYGETLHNHGFLKWNVTNRSAKLVELKNNYGFITIVITDKDYIPKLTNLPKYPRIRIQVDHLLLPHIKEITRNVKKLYKVDDIVVSIINANSNTSTLTDSNAIGNIHNIDYQNLLLKDYLEHTSDITCEIMKSVLQINQKLNSTLKTSEYNLGGSVKLKKLEFSNMFSYAESNVIDFSKLSGIIGLFAPNAQGKSNLIDIILFLLHDSTPRSTKTLDILNVNKKEFYAKLTVEINGLDYTIEKFGKHRFFSGKDLLPVTCNFWVETHDGDIKLLNGEDRRYTVDIIESYVGTLLNSTLTSFSIQNDNTGLINASNAERKNLLSSFLGLDIFNKLYIIATQEAKTIQTLLHIHSDIDYDKDIKNQIEIQKVNRKLYTDTTAKLIKNNEKISKLRSIITKLNINIINNIDSSVNLQDLLDVQNELNKNIELINNDITNNTANITQIKKTIAESTKLLSNYNIELINAKIAEYNVFVVNRNSIKHTLDKLEINIKHQLDKLSKLNDLEYDKDCKYCMNNIFVKDAISTKDLYAKSLELKEKITNELKVLNNTINDYDKYNILLNEYNTLNTNLVIYNKELFQYSNTELKNKNKLIIDTNKLLDIDKKIKNYHENIAAIASNKKIQTEIDNTIKELEILEESNVEYNKLLMQYNTNIELAIEKKKNLLENQTKYNELLLQDKAYTYYINAINKNGIQFNLIKKIIPIFEIEINNVLQQLVDFNINVIVDEKSIDFKIKYLDKSWTLELASGMEKFISSIAIRNALMIISTKPKPNYFIIDEGFSNLDATNTAQLYLLFNYLRNQYDLIILVSHIDSIRDFTDNSIQINKNSAGSNIKFM